MARNQSRQEEYEDEEIVDVTNESQVVSLITSPEWFNFVQQVMMADVEVDVEALTEEFDDEQVKHRKGDFGKILDYVPGKFIRERLNEVLSCKWSFFPLAEHRVTDPIQAYNREKDEYYNSPKYIKILGVLAIPGLGVQAQYGVKKTYGSTEANDWKAATTDAFKKCCSAFGIEADYEIDDEDEAPVEIDLENIEYDDESLEEALDVEVTFGKYKDFTLEEILDEDPSYLEWLVENARENDMRESVAIVLKSAEDKKSSKSKGSKKAKSSKGKSSNSSKSNSSRKSSSSTKSKASTKKDEDDDDERDELVEEIQEIFDESDEYDTVTIKELIKSISVSKKNPNGKRKLEALNLKELKALAEVLTEDDEDEDEE